MRKLREFDLVLVGATGFVGRLTAEHLARSAPTEARIALAGRSAERLAALRADLPEPARAWPEVIIDLTDAEMVTGLVRRARVVATTAGPYAKYGGLLLHACAEAGTDYADLTGETLFVRRSVETCHERAGETGARLVHSCGFDSIPSDLGVGLSAGRAEADGDRLISAVLYVRSARGGINGGTIDSLRGQIDQVRADPSLRPLLADAAALTGTEPARRRPRRTRHGAVERDADTRRWHVPFIMGGFNRQIVFRSNALAGWPYGRDFDYREVVDTGSGVAGLVGAVGVTAGSGALAGAMWFLPTRAVLNRLLPAPGTGPDDETLRRGRFRIEVVAQAASGNAYSTRVGADLDPGYRGTAVMLGESVLALAFDDLPEQGGVLTPMAAMGEVLAGRLRRRGFDIATTKITGEDPDAQDHQVRQAEEE